MSSCYSNTKMQYLQEFETSKMQAYYEWCEKCRAKTDVGKTSSAESVNSDPFQVLDDASSLKMSVLSYGSVKPYHETSFSRNPIVLDTDEICKALQAESSSSSNSSIPEEMASAAAASLSRTVGNHEVLIVGVSNQAATNVGELAVSNASMIGLMHFLLTEPTQKMERLIWLLSVR